MSGPPYSSIKLLHPHQFMLFGNLGVLNEGGFFVLVGSGVVGLKSCFLSVVACRQQKCAFTCFKFLLTVTCNNWKSILFWNALLLRNHNGYRITVFVAQQHILSKNVVTLTFPVKLKDFCNASRTSVTLETSYHENSRKNPKLWRKTRILRLWLGARWKIQIDSYCLTIIKLYWFKHIQTN